MSIVVVSLEIVIYFWSLPACDVQDLTSTAVSSAKVLSSAVGISFLMVLSSESEAIANVDGDSGQPCLIPLVAWKLLCNAPLSLICSEFRSSNFIMTCMTGLGAPKAIKASSVNCREIEGKAAVKSYNI